MTKEARSLPNWPAAMDTALAASYLGLSEASFRAVAAREHVAPIDLGLSVTRWRKRDLDALVDRLPARGANSETEETTDSMVDDALARVRRRQQG